MKEQPIPKDDLSHLRKKKKLRRILTRSLVLILFAAAILVLYLRRNVWIPKLETIGSRPQSQQENSSSSGSFPLSVFGDGDYQLGTISRHLLILTDSYLQIYDTGGGLTEARQHTYGTPMLQTAGDYALVYENGGTHFRLDTTRKTRFEKNLSDPIVFGRVSETGMTAVVTTSETSACRLLVFNAKGQQLYERNCVENLTELSFNADSTGCSAVSMEVENGMMKSVVHAFLFSQTTDLWTSEPLDTLAISVYNTNNGNVFVLGDTRCCYLDSNGAVISTYIYPDTLKQADCREDTAVLLLANDEKRTESLVILRGDAQSPVFKTYTTEVKALEIVPESEAILVGLRDKVETLRYDGTTVKEVAAPNNCEDFLRIDTYLFMKGYGAVDRISYGEQH